MPEQLSTPNIQLSTHSVVKEVGQIWCEIRIQKDFDGILSIFSPSAPPTSFQKLQPWYTYIQTVQFITGYISYMVRHIYGCAPQRVDAIKYGLDWYSTGRYSSPATRSVQKVPSYRHCRWGGVGGILSQAEGNKAYTFPNSRWLQTVPVAMGAGEGRYGHEHKARIKWCHKGMKGCFLAMRHM